MPTPQNCKTDDAFNHFLSGRAGSNIHPLQIPVTSFFEPINSAIPSTQMFNCDECGEIDHILVDGYEFGDTLLEGVMFEIRHNNGKFNAVVQEESKQYFDGLNKKKWLKEAERFSDNNDIAACPKCGEDVSAQPI